MRAGDEIVSCSRVDNAGCAGECLVLTGYGAKIRDEAENAGIMVAEDLVEAVKKCLGE